MAWVLKITGFFRAMMRDNALPSYLQANPAPLSAPGDILREMPGFMVPIMAVATAG